MGRAGPCRALQHGPGTRAPAPMRWRWEGGNGQVHPLRWQRRVRGRPAGAEGGLVSTLTGLLLNVRDVFTCYLSAMLPARPSRLVKCAVLFDMVGN